MAPDRVTPTPPVGPGGWRRNLKPASLSFAIAALLGGVAYLAVFTRPSSPVAESELVGRWCDATGGTLTLRADHTGTFSTIPAAITARAALPARSGFELKWFLRQDHTTQDLSLWLQWETGSYVMPCVPLHDGVKFWTGSADTDDSIVFRRATKTR